MRGELAGHGGENHPGGRAPGDPGLRPEQGGEAERIPEGQPGQVENEAEGRDTGDQVIDGVRERARRAQVELPADREDGAVAAEVPG